MSMDQYTVRGKILIKNSIFIENILKNESEINKFSYKIKLRKFVTKRSTYQKHF